MTLPAIGAPLVEWAQWHIVNGLGRYTITPLRPGEKRPYKQNWTERTLATEAEVEAHWRAFPDDNIGLVPEPGFFWLDADDLDVLEALEKEYGPLPDTYIQRSLNGSLHFLLSGEVAGSPVVFAEGKRLGEIRGARSGQCVGAGSRGVTKAGKPGYWAVEFDSATQPAPAWLLALIGSAPKKAEAEPQELAYGEAFPWDHDQAALLVASALKGEVVKEYEGAFAEGERNNLVYKLFAEAKGRMIHPEAILPAVLESGIDGGLEETPRVCQSVYRDGNTQSAYGEKLPSYWLPNHVMRLAGTPAQSPAEWRKENVAPRASVTKITASGGRESTFGIYRFTDAKGQDDIAPPEWLVENLMPEASYAILFGAEAVFKTFIALDIALTIATHGLTTSPTVTSTIGPVRGGNVLFAIGEGRSGLVKRVQAWRKTYFNGARVEGFFICDPVPLVSDAGIAKFVEGALDYSPEGYKLVVIDTVGRALGGVNESSQEEVSKLTMIVSMLQRQLGATVLALHHTSKTGVTPSGSKEFSATADTMILARRSGDKFVVSLKMVKQKDFENWTKPRTVGFDKVVLKADPLLDSLVAVPWAGPEPQDDEEAGDSKYEQTRKALGASLVKIMRETPAREFSVKQLLDLAVTRGLLSSAAREKIGKHGMVKKEREREGSELGQCFDPLTGKYMWRPEGETE